TIYVSDNGGAFVPFLSDTTQTSAIFNGVNGHTYGFYSIATDNLGNRESPPPVAQTTTKVDTIVPTFTFGALPCFSPGTFNFTWSVADNTGGSGVAGYTVSVSDNGGAFTTLTTAPNQTSLSFTGVNGHTYVFFGSVTDNVGNNTTTPPAGRVTTKVDTTAPTF